MLELYGRPPDLMRNFVLKIYNTTAGVIHPVLSIAAFRSLAGGLMLRRSSCEGLVQIMMSRTGE